MDKHNCQEYLIRDGSSFGTCSECASLWVERRNLFGPGSHWECDLITATLEGMVLKGMTEEVLAEAKNIHAGIEGTLVLREGKMILVMLPIARIGSKTELTGKIYTKQEFWDAGWNLTGRTRSR